MRRLAVVVSATAALAFVWVGAALAQGRSDEAHHHVIVCHRTGSESNPYVVINIPFTAWSEAHNPSSSHAHPPLNGRVDILLKDPASGPGTKDGFTKEDCEAGGAGGGTTTGGTTTGGTTTGGTTTGGTTTGGGGAGGAGGAGGGGALGEAAAGSQPAGELPFTGIPVWMVLIGGLSLIGGGFAVLRWLRPN
jgi:hypothetical protein